MKIKNINKIAKAIRFEMGKLNKVVEIYSDGINNLTGNSISWWLNSIVFWVWFGTKKSN